MIPKFRIHKKPSGEIKYIPEKDKLAKYMQSLAPGIYELTIKKPKKQRSNEQNRYYWGVVVKILSEEWGWLSDDLHDALKWHFLRVPGENGLPDRAGSTASLSTIEFEDYLEKVRVWAITEYEIYIPQPNEIEF